MRRSPLTAAAGLAVVVLAVVVLAVVVLAVMVLAACGAGKGDEVGEDRADQVRDAAREAGLDSEVAEVLALAARGATATFQVTYEGAGGATITVSQDPPNRRVDARADGRIVQSQVVRDGVGYSCAPADAAEPGDRLECRRTQGAIPEQGAFTDEALAAFTEELAGALDSLELTVETRTIAEVRATCLVSAPKAGTTIGGDAPGVDTICLSDDGAQLLVDSAGERVVATTYSTEVPDGTFDI